MLGYFIRRLGYMVITLLIISIIAFVIIQLPPGDYLTVYVAQLESQGQMVSQEAIANLRARYGLGQPMYVQYWKWFSNFIQGDLGVSFEWNRPVGELIWSRLGLTVVISLSTLMFTWVVAFPIGVYSAIHQYSIGDYIFTLIGFIGRATPNFMLALVFMWYFYSKFGMTTWGLFSEQFTDAAWSMAKFQDLLNHLWIPIIVIGTAGTAGLIRIMRANLLDELPKDYVKVARSKGIPGWKVIWKYPVRIALNPFVSTVGWTLPRLISGGTIVSVVLSLPTSGPLFLRSLKSQDMFMAGSFVLLLSTLTVIGTFISDLLLAVLDPRVRYE